VKYCYALVFLLLATSSAFAQTTRPTTTAVTKIGIVVDDMDRSVDFYTHVLDFQKVSDNEVAGERYEQLNGVFGLRCRIVGLTLGNESIELTEYLTPRGRLIPRDSRSNDHWFQHIAIVTTDMDRAYTRLRENKVHFASTGPQTLPQWNKGAAGIRAFYFRDPDDHVLEVINFPSDKGDPKWQSTNDLFPGIDHTAIVVENTEKSLAFYRDALGFRVAGGSENYGVEQEHLNNIQAAHLRITTMKSPAGPGVEFLEYLAPRDGRPYPADSKANDIFAWQTNLATPDAAGLLKDLRERGYTVISTPPSESEFIVRDPDGHAVHVVQNGAKL